MMGMKRWSGEGRGRNRVEFGCRDLEEVPQAGFMVVLCVLSLVTLLVELPLARDFHVVRPPS